LESVPLRGSVWLKRVPQACGSSVWLRLVLKFAAVPLSVRKASGFPAATI